MLKHIKLSYISSFIRLMLVSCPRTHAECSFTDSEAFEHAVEVAAASVYEAAMLALREFRKCGFAEATFGAATRLTIRVKQPKTGTR
jgi:hypothetical protein